MGKTVEITVYGADQLCPSCVNLPSSKDTYEWLQAAISRKYGNDGIEYAYIDIFSPPNNKKNQEFAQRVVEEEFFYPVVLVDDEVAGEGNPKLKTIYQLLEQKGINQVE
ncbi:disulfide oxidoreductase YuzD [Salirhabdus euzebyi]|uniref:Disulfide oxidoreductase YuzD n=1 Tax=Salirhabdus euzebyi TaxID=394506 RepID=A0A841Q519_9BACI|nr:YuzD family protein [Salirhabdus euzebyi]MBB6453432.1 disulfide oxidoreductase YuzD [Salirhabdus euzebyi]